MAETAWAVLPPVITIVLALATKEVYMSLIIGIFSGAMLYANFNVLEAILTMFAVMEAKVGANVNILVFLVILGILVAAITRSGATKAYGDWAVRTIQGRRSALAITALLGIVIFIDDYFNCLTVGTVMRPVTDKFKIARTKLAYIIDATAAPVCILAPISSWAAAVGSSLPEGSSIDGFGLFLQTIPINLYAWLTLIFMCFLVWSEKDFSEMGASIRKNEREFIAACIYGMLYTGGIHDGLSVAEAFANCDSSKSLVLGSFIAFVFTGLLYLPRRVVSFNDFCTSFILGFKAMSPALFILCLAWTLSGICSDKYLDLGGYVGQLVSANAGVITFLPVIFFLVGAGLAFATGTSWGTFGILIPIAIAIVGTDSPVLTLCVAAILSGAVAGDHASPISDTTILASAGAQCHHIDHVSTQIPYVLVVVSVCVVGYIVDGLTMNGWLGLAVALAILAVVMAVVYWKVPVPLKDRSAD